MEILMWILAGLVYALVGIIWCIYQEAARENLPCPHRWQDMAIGWRFAHFALWPLVLMLNALDWLIRWASGR